MASWKEIPGIVLLDIEKPTGMQSRGVLNFELGMDVRPEASTTTL